MEKNADHEFLSLGVTEPAQWSGDLLVSILPGEEKPQPGMPGKTPGDTLLVAGPSDGMPGPARLMVSAGLREKVDAEALRRAGGAAAKWLAGHTAASAGLDTASLQEMGNVPYPEAVFAVSEGLLLGSFRFQRRKTGDSQASIGVQLLGEPGVLQPVVDRARAIATGVNLAREIAHEPANIINPETLSALARQVAGNAGLKITVLGVEELQALGAGAILSVGQGSQTGSRLIVLEYPGSGAAGQAPVAVVGKAITFDTGGYSIKDRTGMVGMKYDKSGGADVLGILRAASLLRLPVPLVGIIAAAENMISEDAYRPNDIITSLSGKTIEIISTDAEGRMVLADALTYAHTHYQPRAIIDLATLTGGVVVALGEVRAGLLSNNDALAKALFEAGERTHERLWRLPLDDDYFDLIKGDDSDIKNSSGGRAAHPVIGGIFLKQFVPDNLPWAHLDIAGPATTEKDLPYIPKGGTGFGVRLVLDYLERL